MRYLKYFENYDEEGLVRKFYENALHHDDVNALKKVSNKYNTNPLDFITDVEIIDYNAMNILDYLLSENKLSMDFNKWFLKDTIIKKGQLKLPNILYKHGYYTEFIENLETLEINGRKLNSLDGIEIFKNLKTLVCMSNYITSIEPIRYLEHLETLNFHHNYITDLKPLEYLHNLTGLNASRNKIISIEPISNLTRLDYIDFENNYIESVEPISNLTELNEIGFKGNYITDLRPIEHLLPQLNDFSFGNNPLDDYSEDLLKKYVKHS